MKNNKTLALTVILMLFFSFAGAAETKVKKWDGKTLLNINTCSKDELKRLPGVGEVIAQRIIDNRPYKTAQDLQGKVKGLGEKKVMTGSYYIPAIKDLITF